jgi:hypothetical protein
MDPWPDAAVAAGRPHPFARTGGRRRGRVNQRRRERRIGARVGFSSGRDVGRPPGIPTHPLYEPGGPGRARKSPRNHNGSEKSPP